jgi:hypothetical protein
MGEFFRKIIFLLGNKISQNRIFSILIIIIIFNFLRAILVITYSDKSKFTFTDLFFYGVFGALLVLYIRHCFSESSFKKRFKIFRPFNSILQQTKLQFPEKFKHV